MYFCKNLQQSKSKLNHPKLKGSLTYPISCVHRKILNTLKGIHKYQKLNKEELELASKKWWETGHSQSWAEGRWVLGTQRKDPSNSLLPIQLSDPWYEVIHPLVSTFSKPKDFAFMTTLWSSFNNKMENQSFPDSLTETWWLCCTSMGHESCEPEPIQAEPLFDPAQSLVVKAQPRQLKHPWSIYSKPKHLNHQTKIYSWKVLLHFKVF